MSWESVVTVDFIVLVMNIIVCVSMLFRVCKEVDYLQAAFNVEHKINAKMCEAFASEIESIKKDLDTLNKDMQIMNGYNMDDAN